MSQKLPPEIYSPYPSKEPSIKAPEPKEELPSWMSIDFIIKNIFPILGVLMIAGGIGYFFYTGFWDSISKTGRLGLGFISGIALIIGGYSFSDKLKQFADSIIGGGILTLYITLIYGSRFDFAEEFNTQIISEGFALLTSLLFCGAICGYSVQRKSLSIVSLGMLGAYLTPFFIGQVGSFEYDISFNSFLLYFLAIVTALLFTSFKMNIISLAWINTLGLFFGVLGLSGLMGNGFLETPFLSVGICLTILAMHLGFITINSHKYSPSIALSSWYYIAPFLWIITIIYGFLGMHNTISNEILYTPKAIGVGLVSLLYFLTWYGIEKKTDLPQYIKNIVYGIGTISLCGFLLEFSDVFGKYTGLIISTVAICFASLHFISPRITREISWFILSTVGFFTTLASASQFVGNTFIFDHERLVGVLSLIPFLLHFILPSSSSLKFHNIRKFSAWIATAGIMLLLGQDIITHVDIPLSLILGTIPAGITAVFAMRKQGIEALELAGLSVVLLCVGYTATFFSFWEKLFPAHTDTFLINSESLIAGSTLLIAGILWNWSKKISTVYSSVFSFSIIALCTTVLFQWISYEIVGLYNLFFSYDFDITSDMRGVRAAMISFWWVILAGGLIFLGVKNNSLYTIEKRIGVGILAIALGKIFLYDLANVDTNLKVLIFIITGSILLGISYVFQQKSNSQYNKEF